MIPKRVFWLLDAVAMLGAALLAEALFRSIESLFNDGGLLRSGWFDRLQPPSRVYWDFANSEAYIWLILGFIPLVLVCLDLMGNYAPLFKQSRSRVIFGCLIAPLASLSMVSLVLFLFRAAPLSRFVVAFYALSCSIVLCAFRLSLRAYVRSRERQGHYTENVLLVGGMAGVRRVAEVLADPTFQTQYRAAGYISGEEENAPFCEGGLDMSAGARVARGSASRSAGLLEAPRHQAGAGAERLKRLGSFDDLRGVLRDHQVHEVAMVLPSAEAAWSLDVKDACEELGVTLRVIPEALLFHRGKALRASRIKGDLPLPGVLLLPTHHRPEELFVKRCADAVGSALLLLLLSPLMAIVALAIKLSDPKAPLTFGFLVIGQHGVPFRVYKFRTMIPNADQVKGKLMAVNEMTGPVFKMKNDPRITPLGRFLRKFSIDELPQLWNVLRGDLSLVGPRALRPHEVQGFDFWHRRRLTIKPGLTCLWQVRGRNKVSNFDDWANMDLEYIDNWSLWLDFKILLLTIPAVISGTGQ